MAERAAPEIIARLDVASIADAGAREAIGVLLNLVEELVAENQGLRAELTDRTYRNFKRHFRRPPPAARRQRPPLARGAGDGPRAPPPTAAARSVAQRGLDMLPRIGEGCVARVLWGRGPRDGRFRRWGGNPLWCRGGPVSQSGCRLCVSPLLPR
jgi:hypothetical protein